MRALSSTLTAAQQTLNKAPLWKVVLSRAGQTMRGYDKTRILKLSHTETPKGTTAEITLQNSDAALTAIDFEHFQAEISYGYNTGVTPATWQPNHAYSLEDVVISNVPNGYQYKCRAAGTSATTENFKAGDNSFQGFIDPTWEAQTFTPAASYQIVGVKLLLYRAGTPGTITVSITATDINGDPTGADLCSGTTDGNTLPTGSPYEWRYISFGTGVALTSGTKYAIVARIGGGDGSNFVAWRRKTTAGYSGGNQETSSDGGATWAPGTADMMFEVIGNEPTWPTSLGTTVTDGGVTWEMDGNQGDEYSRCAPLRCRAQELHSGRGILKLILRPVGILDQLAEDKAAATVSYAAGNTLTVQDHLTNLAGTSLAPYSSYTGYTVTYDSTDGLITSFKPAEYYAIRLNDSRRDKLQWLLGLTGCQIRAANDGNLHVLVPVTSGTAYAYQYQFNTSGQHPFWSKTVRNRFVNPNKEIVTSPPTAGTIFAGTATSATSFALAPKIRTTQLTLASTAQASSIATAKINQNELAAEKGFAVVPMNVGQELWDYVKITDSRENDTVTGNVQYVRRDVEVHPAAPLTWQMLIAFGETSALSLMSNMLDAGLPTKLTDDQILKWFEQITAWQEQQSQQIDFIDETYITASDSSIPTTLDGLADGTTYKRVLATSITAGAIRLDATYGTLDNIANGSTYAKVLTTAISAGNIILQQVVTSTAATYVSNAQTSSWTGKPDNMDNIPGGTTYQKILATNLSAGNIKLTSAVVAQSTWYNFAGVSINASTGIDIFGGSTAFRTYASATSATIQCYIGSDGMLYAQAGNVWIGHNDIDNVDELGIQGASLRLYNGGTKVGVIDGNAAGLFVDAVGNTGTSKDNLTLSSAHGDVIVAGNTLDVNNTPMKNVKVTVTDVTATRAWSTAYQNTSTVPMEVAFYAQAATAVSDVAVISVGCGASTAANSAGIQETIQPQEYGCLTKIIPPGWYYRMNNLTMGTVPTLSKVYETTVGT